MMCRVFFLLLFALPAFAAQPPVMLWAWEQPEDLRFIDPQTTGVAYLAKSLYLRAGKVIARPRLQPLQIPPGTYVTVVLRIESDQRPHSDLQRAAVVNAVLAAAKISRVSGVQIDFDAAVSERAFYTGVISEIHNGLPAHKSLSITALASWCLGDRWLSNLPLDDAVPMLFRMGPDGPQILQHLTAGRDFAEPLCRKSLGISTDEPGPALHAGKQLYVFHPGSWTAAAFRSFNNTVTARSAP